MLLLRSGRLEAQGEINATLRKASQMGFLPHPTHSFSGAQHETHCFA